MDLLIESPGPWKQFHAEVKSSIFRMWECERAHAFSGCGFGFIYEAVVLGSPLQVEGVGLICEYIYIHTYISSGFLQLEEGFYAAHPT